MIQITLLCLSQALLGIGAVMLAKSNIRMHRRISQLERNPRALYDLEALLEARSCAIKRESEIKDKERQQLIEDVADRVMERMALSERKEKCVI